MSNSLDFNARIIKIVIILELNAIIIKIVVSLDFSGHIIKIIISFDFCTQNIKIVKLLHLVFLIIGTIICLGCNAPIIKTPFLALTFLVKNMLLALI